MNTLMMRTLKLKPTAVNFIRDVAIAFGRQILDFKVMKISLNLLNLRKEVELIDLD
jgi:hypothetical protein